MAARIGGCGESGVGLASDAEIVGRRGGGRHGRDACDFEAVTMWKRNAGGDALTEYGATHRSSTSSRMRSGRSTASLVQLLSQSAKLWWRHSALGSSGRLAAPVTAFYMLITDSRVMGYDMVTVTIESK